MEALRDRLMARKEELLAEIAENGPPPPETRTFHAQVAHRGLPS
jgi:hypothetical protein